MRTLGAGNPEFGNSRRVLTIVYGAMFASIGVYWIVLELLASPLADTSPPNAVRTAFFLIAGGSCVTVVYLRSSRLTPLLADGSADPARLLARLRAYYLLCYALSESVALYGFVLRFLGADRMEAALYFVVAIILFLLCYPRLPERS